MHSWGPVMGSSLTKKPKAGRRDWSPVGVVVPLDEGNAGGREKSHPIHTEGTGYHP